MTVLTSGCATEHHRWQTVVNEDSSVDRTIARPLSGTPAEAEVPEAWQFKRFHKDMDRTVWPERLTQERIDFANSEHEKEPNYFIAGGKR